MAKKLEFDYIELVTQVAWVIQLLKDTGTDRLKNTYNRMTEFNTWHLFKGITLQEKHYDSIDMHLLDCNQGSTPFYLMFISN